MSTNERSTLIESHLREAVRMGIGWPKSDFLDRWIAEQVASLAAALDQEHPEPEWQYGIQYEDGYPRPVVNEEVARKNLRLDLGDRLLRRSAPGPWVTVEGEVR